MSNFRLGFYLISICWCFTSWAMDRVEILISDSAKAYLESDPYHSDKVPAKWIADGDTTEVSVSYRGAYSLQNLIRYSPSNVRNWKLKMPKGITYRGYRQWNFNQEMHVRQELTFELYNNAGLIALPSRHVVLYVNGSRTGLYLEYPDPDNKPWLVENFGSDDGDLFKAATDLPGSPGYFGELNYLGNQDSNYYRHYQKKTNNDNADSLDYSSIRNFLTWAKNASDAEFKRDLPSRFDLGGFIRYLVVSNYAGHWDGFPNRGKNFWLYLNPLDQKWRFIPWDVDATFQNYMYCLNNMGPEAGLFFMNWPKSYCQSDSETVERSFFERVMAVDEWKHVYIGEYQKALKTYLKEETLLAKVDSLTGVMEDSVLEASSEADDVEEAKVDMRTFITKRATVVSGLLAGFPTYEPVPVRKPSNGKLQGKTNTGDWLDIRGRKFSSSQLPYTPSGVYWRGLERKVVLH